MALAVFSGFEPARLLSIYPWVPLASLLFFITALYWGLGGRGSMSAEGRLSRPLTVFVVVFLSSHRLSILQSPGTLWTYCFWLQPYLGFTFGLFFIWIRLLGGADRTLRYGLVGIVLGVIALLEPRVGLYAAAGALSWAAFDRRPVGRVSLTLALAGALFWLGRGALQPVPLAEESRAWYVAFNSLLSLTLDKGLIFYLGCFGFTEMIRSRKPNARLFSSLWFSGFVLWIVSAISTPVAVLLHPELLHAYLQLLLVAAAGLGAYRSLAWIESKIESLPAFRPSLPCWIRGRRLQTMGIASFVALSLPWNFPYWWHPPRMDPVYLASVPPLSRQFVGLGDWIRTGTSEQAVFVAGPSYACWIAALSGRRVLLVEPSVSVPKDHSSREQAQSRFVGSKDRRGIEMTAEKWGITHLAWGRLDQEHLQVDYRFFESDRLFEERYRLRRWVRIFELQLH
jgi:hypothetical protein